MNDHTKEVWVVEMWARMLKAKNVEISKYVPNTPSSRSHLSQFGCAFFLELENDILGSKREVLAFFHNLCL
jgi:hypothetical protein